MPRGVEGTNVYDFYLWPDGSFLAAFFDRETLALSWYPHDKTPSAISPVLRALNESAFFVKGVVPYSLGEHDERRGRLPPERPAPHDVRVSDLEEFPDPLRSALVITIEPITYQPDLHAAAVQEQIEYLIRLAFNGAHLPVDGEDGVGHFVWLNVSESLLQEWKRRKFPATVLAEDFFNRLNERIEAASAPLVKEFANYLTTLKDHTTGSLEGNQRIATLIQETADALRVAIACMKCGEPSRFRCSRSETIPTGAFVCAHDRQTHGGTPEIPELKLTEPMTDRRKVKPADKN